MKLSLLQKLSDGFDLAALVAMLLPLAFPAVAICDGASLGNAGYLALSTIYLAIAVVASMLVTGVCLWLSSVCEWISLKIEGNRKERQEATRAMHAYLLNGGRI